MKTILIGLLALSSLAAFAGTPGIGTFSEYKVTGEAYSGTYKIEIAAIDESLQKVTTRYTTSINGSVNIDEEVLEADQVNSKEMNEQLLELCESDVGGKLEDIEVPAGRFKTCKVSGEDGQVVFIGAVPFGFVKAITKDGTMELRDSEYKN